MLLHLEARDDFLTRASAARPSVQQYRSNAYHLTFDPAEADKRTAEYILEVTAHQ